ncbi:hypothetical protein BLA60_14555 [Actinophytocola xinjiangensis]|uniref:Uncharacterized protein n=1 Tax=Actinophytocola xinjiangensis TaxID=485602 RepID=A0A7Z0WNX4_9PSEU|nr:hypothetical protein [Actinophytocola xinjiangensis]OLF11260.1 hypothetical protein BLA60_14555 [Actinophytocola xinjiangensis]
MARQKSTRPPFVSPYITSWSEEVDPPCRLVEIPGRGIAYADETVTDRDQRGVLWLRTPYRPGIGRPVFGKVHPLRQRRAMSRLLCQVCGGSADHDDNGVLWLARDWRDDWPDWPNGMGENEPPVCLPCVRLSMRLCPALRRGAVAFRARRFPVAGIRGAQYAAGPRFVGDVTVALDDPTIPWIRAANLVRRVSDCTILDLDEICG